MEGPRRVTSPPSFEIKDPSLGKGRVEALEPNEFQTNIGAKGEKNYVSCYGPGVSDCDCKLIHHSGAAHDPQPTRTEGRSIRHGPRKRIKSVLVQNPKLSQKSNFKSEKGSIQYGPSYVQHQGQTRSFVPKVRRHYGLRGGGPKFFYVSHLSGYPKPRSKECPLLGPLLGPPGPKIDQKRVQIAQKRPKSDFEGSGGPKRLERRGTKLERGTGHICWDFQTNWEFGGDPNFGPGAPKKGPNCPKTAKI